jgi:MFS family permease
MIGPVVAGLLMAWHGPSLVFLFDGLSFLGLIFILKNLNLREVKRDINKGSSSWYSLKEAYHYIANNNEMKFYALQLLSTILFVFPVMVVVLRTYIKLKFNLTGDEFGYVFAFPATGATLGALCFAAIKPKNPTDALIFAVPLATLLLFLAPLSTNLWLTVGIITLLGFCTYMCFASLTVSLHLKVQEEFRGRIGAYIGIAFVSLGPLASYPIGVLADNIGYEKCIYIFASVFGILSALHKWQAHKTSLNAKLVS